MNAEKQRIKIAEACGIFNCITVIEAWRRDKPTRLDGYREWQRVVVPNYLNDLNAIHAAIATLPFDHQITVAELLAGDLVDVMQATAAQRCEAFLRTIGNWTND